MNVLQRFERRLGGFVEGAFARVFRGGVEPVEIAGALARECDDRKAISATRVLVPNEFHVELGPADHERLSPYAEPLADELASMVREHAEGQHYSFVGPVQVDFGLDEALPVGTFRVRSGVRGDTPAAVTPAAVTPAAFTPAPVGQPTETAPLPAAPTVVTRLAPTARLVSLVDGQEYPLRGPRLLAGRSQQADVRLADAGVSRRHAEFVHDGAIWWLADLGSTNGSHVNGAQVTRAELHDGDRIEFGPVALVFHDGSAL
jgi:hypothetical protein